MVSSRTATAIVGLVVSLAVSVIAWRYFDTFLLFLFVPFVPFLFRGMTESDQPPVKTCPVCGFRTQNPEYLHCPRDGAELEERS